jgi:23S rRNA (adenine2503-C2)-methyltransferase
LKPVSLYGLDRESMESFIAGLGEKPFRARQILSNIYRRGVLDLAGMTELSVSLREKLAREATLDLPALVEKQVSRDGTEKLLLELGDGERIETVLIPEEGRLTQCVSTQVGCAMGCRFCRTAGGGLVRNLEAGEIVAQIIAAQKYCPELGRVTNVVFMGMGEPLHNYDAVVRAFSIITSDWGISISRRKVTVSTSGLVDAIKKLPHSMLMNLAVSLNATTDEQRSAIMPVNQRWPIAELLKTLATLELPDREHYTIEYVLLGGFNDTLEDAKRLAKLLAPIKCKINLIPYNPHEGSHFKAPSPEDVRKFQEFMLEKNFVAMVRKSRGEDILAACGQLRAERAGCPAGPEKES